ncbi:MAG: hypothetical protein CMK59_06545 [Proteobacteria bacterium]|nr:hypothetical protein [Pseudomonadota bacterium]
MRYFVLLTALIGISCGSENDLKEIVEPDTSSPLLVVDPMLVDFGVVDPGDNVTSAVTFRNDGDRAVEITDVVLEGVAFMAASAAPVGILGPGESTEMILSYSPLNIEDHGWLKVSSDDPASEEVYVELVGMGAIPLLTIEPAQLDMGWIDLDQTIEDGYVLRNDGMTELTITESLLVGEDFWVTEEDENGIWPVVLSPGEETFLEVAYSPRAYGEHTGTLWVESDTPAGTTQAGINGGCAPTPVAVCEVTPEEIAPHSQSATWIGENSYDLSGAEIVEYDWTLLSKPEGSVSYIPNGGANRPNFSPDLAGTYVGQLVVYNEWGRASLPCEATLEAVPKESLWVEIYWEHPGDDMDLHLVRPGGALESNNDCYYMNCVNGGWLDWGVLGYPDDDPSLDIDDITGTGPENINVLDPENGTFEVWIHDYPGSVYNNPNDVTVRIYLSGQLVWEDTKTISGENSYTLFAEVLWPDALVVPQ